jgi:hypothetical protein
MKHSEKAKIQILPISVSSGAQKLLASKQEPQSMRAGEDWCPCSKRSETTASLFLVPFRPSVSG